MVPRARPTVRHVAILGCMKLNGVWLFCGAVVIVAAGIAPPVSAVPATPSAAPTLGNDALATAGCQISGRAVLCPSGADLSGANLRGVNLRRANLTEANLSGANLSGADLRGANLYWANLNEANLRQADLYRANLTEANLTEANLRQADLRGADLRGADLYWAYLAGANLSGVKWGNTMCPDGTLTDTSC